MALLSVQVSGPVIAPSGLSPYAASIEFALRGAASIDTTVALPELVTVPVLNGAISTPLKGETNGLVYDVTYIALLGGTKKRVALGPIVLDQEGTFSLAALLPVPIPANTTDTLRIKRGDTLDVSPQMLNEWGRPIPLSGVNVASSVLGPDGVRRNLTVSKLDAAKGILQIVAAASATALWPLGKYQWDVKFRNGTTVDHTKTGTIIVEQEITP